MRKATNISFLAILVLYALVIAIALTSCRPVKVLQGETIVKDSVVYKDTTVYVKVPPIVVPGDTVELIQLIPCADTVRIMAEATSKTGRTTVSAQIDNGILKVDCKTDSLRREIDSLKALVQYKEMYQHKSTTQYVPIPQEYVPWWVWILAGVAVFLIIVFGINLFR